MPTTVEEWMRAKTSKELRDIAMGYGIPRTSRMTKRQLAEIVAKRAVLPKDPWSKALQEAMEDAFGEAEKDLPKGGRRDYDAYGRPIPQPGKFLPEPPKFTGAIKWFEYNGKTYQTGTGQQEIVLPDGAKAVRNAKTREWELSPERGVKYEIQKAPWRQEYPPQGRSQQSLENELVKLRARIKELEAENKALQTDIDFLLGPTDEGSPSGSPPDVPPKSEVVEVKDLEPPDDPNMAEDRELYPKKRWCIHCNGKRSTRAYFDKDMWVCNVCGKHTTGMEAAKAGRL